MTSLLIMSLRGRVLKRVPYAPDAPAASYQSQLAQYKFLARALHFSDYESHTFAGIEPLVNWLKAQNKLVPVKSLYEEWAGPQDALALVCPLGKSLVLSMYASNVMGSTIPTGARGGFIYQKANQQWVNSTALWDTTGNVSSPVASGLDIVINKVFMTSTSTVLGKVSSAEYFVPSKDDPPVACLFVHPFFNCLTPQVQAVQLGSYMEEKLY